MAPSGGSQLAAGRNFIRVILHKEENAFTAEFATTTFRQTVCAYA
jgi:hypothetical protein